MRKRLRSALGLPARPLGSEHGVSAVEYALLLGLIAAVVIGVVVIVGHHVSNEFQSFTTQLASHHHGGPGGGGPGPGGPGPGGPGGG